jgi:hypothetical protein
MKKILKRLLIGLVTVGALVAVTFFLLAISSRKKIKELRQQIVDSGDYLEITDFPLANPIAEENGFIYLSETTESLNSIEREISEAGLDDVYDIDGGGQLSKENIAKIEAILQSYPELLPSLSKASLCTEYRSSFNPSDGYAAGLPHLPVFRSACRALALKALMEAYRGRGDSAIDICGMMLRISRHADSEPLLVAHLVSVACTSVSLSTANQVLNISKVSDQSIDQFVTTLNSLDSYGSLVNAVKGERAMAVMTFQQLREGKLGDELSGAIPYTGSFANNWITEAYLNEDEAAFLRIMSEQIRWIQEPKPTRDQKIKEVTDSLNDSSDRFLVTKLVLPALSQVIESTDRIEAKIRCLRLRILSKKSDAPTLDKIEVPTPGNLDPYTREPLIRKQQDEGAVIYSVGANLVDDDGAIFPSESSDTLLDIGFGPNRAPVTPATE